MSDPSGFRCRHKWDPVEALRTVENHRVTHFTGVPTMTWEMIHHPDVGKVGKADVFRVFGVLDTLCRLYAV